jgi:hypothetical protein
MVLLVCGRISGYGFIPLKFRNRFRSTAKQLKRDRCVGSEVVDNFRKVKPAVTRPFVEFGCQTFIRDVTSLSAAGAAWPTVVRTIANNGGEGANTEDDMQVFVQRYSDCPSGYLSQRRGSMLELPRIQSWSIKVDLALPHVTPHSPTANVCFLLRVFGLHGAAQLLDLIGSG